MTVIKVLPVADRSVRDPVTLQILPAEGWDVNDDDLFWSRRIDDGDVTIAGGGTLEAQALPDLSMAAPTTETSGGGA